MMSLIVAAWLAMQVQGAGSCPSPGEVEEKLAPLLPVGFASGSTDLATVVEEADGTLSVSLARPDGKTVARRRLPRAPSSPSRRNKSRRGRAMWCAVGNSTACRRPAPMATTSKWRPIIH